MVIGKYCIECKEFFPATVGSYISCCSKPACQTRWAMIVEHIKHSRNIDAKYFDLWDSDLIRVVNGKDYPGHFERVCRICGTRLLKKDGTYNAYRRQCEAHTDAMFDYYWPSVRDQFLFENQKIHKEEIAAFFVERTKTTFKQPLRWEVENYAYCEGCSQIGICDVHHNHPVHTLTKDNIGLIWDPKNLKCLCKTCHNRQDHQLTWKAKLPIPEMPKYKVLDRFFGNTTRVVEEEI